MNVYIRGGVGIIFFYIITGIYFSIAHRSAYNRTVEWGGGGGGGHSRYYVFSKCTNKYKNTIFKLRDNKKNKLNNLVLLRLLGGGFQLSFQLRLDQFLFHYL